MIEIMLWLIGIVFVLSWIHLLRRIPQMLANDAARLIAMHHIKISDVRNPFLQYKCQSFYNEDNVLQDCTCGRCK